MVKIILIYDNNYNNNINNNNNKDDDDDHDGSCNLLPIMNNNAITDYYGYNSRYSGPCYY